MYSQPSAGGRIDGPVSVPRRYPPMIGGDLAMLFTGLFDDAAMFPPRDDPVRPALTAHLAHRVSWYGDLVGPFVCAAGQLTRVDALAARHGIDRLDVALVVPDGLDALDQALEWVARCSCARIAALELPLGQHRFADAVERLEPLVRHNRRVYLEIPVPVVNEDQVHELAPTGIRLKIRTGGTSIEAFQSEASLARPIVWCAAERLAFKCTAGLHHAARHRDSSTLFEHHGFLNIALAARVAAGTGNHAATRAVLGERDPRALAYQIGDLSADDVGATRALFDCFATAQLDDAIADLLEMGLVSVP